MGISDALQSKKRSRQFLTCKLTRQILVNIYLLILKLLANYNMHQQRIAFLRKKEINKKLNCNFLRS
jgi:hypothetical protein